MIFSTVDRDGLPLPLSIFLMVEMAISDMSARSCWVIPKALRCNFITSWIFISSSVLYCTFCAKIRNVFGLNKQKYHIMCFLWKITISWDFYYFISFYFPYHSIMIVQLTKLYWKCEYTVCTIKISRYALFRYIHCFCT